MSEDTDDLELRPPRGPFDAIARDYLWRHAPVLALVLDAEDRIVDANVHARRVLGADVIGTPAMARALHARGVFPTRDMPRDGATRLLNLQATDGTFETWHVSCFDLGDRTLLLGASDPAEQETLRREVAAVGRELGDLTRELSRKNAHLAHLDAVRDRFLGLAAHDLEVPLKAMRTYSQFLLGATSGRLTDEERTCVEVLHSSCQFMVRLVDDFLNISTLEPGRLSLQRRPVEVALLLDSSLALARVHAQRKGVVLEVDAQPVPLVRVDAHRMEQALNNLLLHAIHHAAPGGVVRLATHLEGAEWVTVVGDGGQASARDAEPGLAMARQIVQAHGGRLTVDSQPPRGTTLTVHIPAQGEPPRD